MNSWGLKLLAAAVATGLVFFFLPPPKQAGPEIPSARRPSSEARLGPIDASSLHGREVFAQLDAKRLIAGVPQVYTSALLWAAELEPGEDGNFRATDARFLVNATPKTQEELDSLVQIDPKLPVGLIAESLEKRRDDVLWIRSPKAILVGGARLSDLRELRLQGEVRMSLPASWTPMGQVDGRLGDLLLKLGDGQPKELSSPDPSEFKSLKGRLVGRGLEIDFEAQRASLARDIAMDLVELGEGRGGLVPLSLKGRGPLIMEPATPEGSAGPIRVSLAGPVEIDSLGAGVKLRGERLELRISGLPRTIVSIVVEGQVSVVGRFGSCSGDRLTYRLLGERESLCLDGKDVSAELEQGGQSLPLGGRDQKLFVKTPGTITLMLPRAGGGDDTELLFGPQVSLKSETSQVEAEGMARLVIARSKKGPSALDRERNSFLRSLRLDGGVEGKGPRGRFDCAVLEFERKGAVIERPEGEELRLGGEAHLLVEMGDSPERKMQRCLELEGRSLIFDRDPLGLRPLSLKASGWVNAKWLKKPRNQGWEVEGAERSWVEEAWLQGASLDARFRIRDVAGANATKKRSGFRLLNMVVEGGVIFQDPSGGELRCQRMTLDDGRGRIVASPVPGRRVHLRFIDGSWKVGKVSGQEMTLDSASRRVWVRGEVIVAMELPSLMTPSSGSWFSLGPSLPAKMKAGEVTVTLSGWGPHLFPRKARVQGLSARSKVQLTQEGSRLDCRSFEADLAHSSLVADGAPVVFVCERSEQKERLSAHSLIGRREKLLLRGAVECDVLCPRLFKTKVGEESTEYIMTRLRTQGDILFANERIVLSRKSRLSQGDPAVDGCDLDAEKIFVALKAPKPGGAKTLHSATARGRVKFKTRGLRGEGEELIYSRAAEALSLFDPGGKATITLDGFLQAPRSRWDVDLHDPAAPRVIAISPPGGGHR